MASPHPFQSCVCAVGQLLVLHHCCSFSSFQEARLAQPAERKALNLVVVGSRPTVGAMASARARASICSFWAALRTMEVAALALIDNIAP